MSDALWVVRAGIKAAHMADFLTGSYIAISFVDVYAGDLAQTDEPTLKARATTPTLRTQTGQLTAFAYKMDVGDLVIVPRLTNRHREYAVARITSAYHHSSLGSASGPHRRDVTWLGVISYDALSLEAANTLGSILTVFRPTAIEAELRGHLTALTPLELTPQPHPDARSTNGGAVPPARTPVTPAPQRTAGTPEGAASQVSLPVALTPLPRSFTETQLEITLDGHGRARITCAYPALVMEQTPRHTEPATDWVGVPGIYILTGTTLQNSSQRTGIERTLTTTLIVRPWAYVGLSENFLGRLTSHRQTKQEWRRALLVRSGAAPFSSDDIKYLEHRVHAGLADTEEVMLDQSTPRGNLSAQPRNTTQLDACADTIIAVLRLTGTLI